jgi:hypothetical protein
MALTVRERVGFSGFTQDTEVPDALGPNARRRSLLNDLGSKLIRVDVQWDAAERVRGVYNFSEYDDIFKLARERGERLIIILDFNNPLYAESWNSAITTDAQIQGFTRFAVEAVKRYDAPNVIWEFYNEPNHADYWSPQTGPAAYMRLLAHAVPQMRAAAPKAFITAPALGHRPADSSLPIIWDDEPLDFAYLRGCLELDLLKYVDAVSIHPYPQSNPEVLTTTYARTRSLLTEFNGQNMPLISSETGYATSVVSEENQSRWLVRQVLVNLNQNIPFTALHQIMEVTFPGNSTEESFGIVARDGRKKPAYAALKEMFAAIGDLRYTQRLSSADDEWLLEFVGLQNRVIAAWTTGNPRSLSIGDRRVLVGRDPIFIQVR